MTSTSTIQERLRDELEAVGIDGFIHFQTGRVREYATLRYLSGVGGLEDSGLIFPADAEPVLVVKDFEEVRARRESWIRDVRGVTTIPLSAATKALGDVIREKGLIGKKLGVDESELTLEVYMELQKLGVQLVPFGSTIARMRMRKTREEIEKIRRAVEIAESAINKVEGLVGEGLTEAELAAEATLTIEKSGGSKAFVIVQYAENAAIPHGGPTVKPVRGDGLLVVDLGANVEGYNSDITRTIIVGRPPAKQVEYVRAVWEALNSAIARAAPGVGVWEVARAARSVIGKRGLPQPRHRIGHGLGLNVHENPIVEEGFNHILEPGNTITIEPGVYFDGVCGVRFEVDVQITKDGCEVLDSSTLKPTI
ncbi:MAG: Xaa-Pro peptidase family protein [Thermoprotei archaeon]